MSRVDYREITKESELDLRLPNESFDVFGKLIVSRLNENWKTDIELFSEVHSIVFPNEAYQFEEMNKDGFALGAYEGGNCIGLAVFKANWNSYMYVYDLKVNQKFRKKGIAEELISRGLKIALKLGYVGLYTVAQDNNIAACTFYLKQKFIIGGLNTNDYKHTKQEGKSDIYFYLEG